MDKSDLNCNRKLYMWRLAAMLEINLSISVEIQTLLPSVKIMSHSYGSIFLVYEISLFTVVYSHA